MKNFLLIALLFTTSFLFAQIPKNPNMSLGSLPEVTIDTNFRVQYVDRTKPQKLPLYYLNGKQVTQEVMQVMSLEIIDSVAVNKDSIKVDNVMYYGQIHLRTKAPYSQQFITLGELKAKYTNLKNEPAIFIVDGEIIHLSPDKYVVNEGRLWRIFVDKIEDKSINLKTIKILTKTDHNIKKSAEMRIRGASLSNGQ